MELRTAIAVEDDALAFLNAMAAVNVALDIDWLLNLLEKPWKWQGEYELWIKHGRPSDPSHERFADFTEACDRVAARWPLS